MAADKVEATATATSPVATTPDVAPTTASSAAATLPAKASKTSAAPASTGDDAGQQEAAAAAAAAAATAGDGKEEEEEMSVFITVHPPLVPTTTGAAATPPLVLEPLAGMELVMQVRQLLTEIPQTCLYSAFRLVAVTPKDGDGGGDGDGDAGDDKGGGGADDDVWQGPGDVMNDFVELRSIPAVVARPQKVDVRMELESYTIHTARQHVNRFRELLRYPPPCPDGIGPGVRRGAGSGGKKGKGKSGGGGKNKKAAKDNEKEKDNAAAKIKKAGQAADGSAVDKVEDKAEADPAAEAAAQRIKRALDIRGRIKDARMPVVGTEGLGSFYGVGLGLAVEEVAAPSPSSSSAKASENGVGKGTGGDKDMDGPVTCLKGISVSAWNPPPPQRRMIGDLMYLEVVALDGTVIHVTCTQGGFYVNGSGRGTFDPKPIVGNACHSHELAVCLLARNASFAKAWNNAVKQAWRRIQSDDPVHALARAFREGRGDAVMVKPQWNMPVPDSRWAEHKADPSRAQEDLSSGFGMEDRGVPREWNDEYQCLLELPNDTPELSMTRSRALHKLLCDFQEAATAGAVAISDGFIPPANPTEVEHSHVFVFNNIFFSYAADSPDAYKAVSGEAAARKSASQDLASVVALNLLGEAFHPQLSIKTLATAVVDFSGRRLIAQSLVPGILNGDQTNKVVYGAMEHGQPLRENEKVASLLKDVGQRLMIAEREMDAIPIKKAKEATDLDSSSGTATKGGSTAGTADAVTPTDESSAEGTTEGSSTSAAATVKITGAVEMKGIVGSDGRSYLLDVSRVTPRDANWVRGEKGTGVYKHWSEAQAEKPTLAAGEWEELVEGEREGQGRDLSFEDMAVLRPELLTSFTRHKVGEWFRTRNAELRDSASDKSSTEPLAEKETIPSPSVLAEEASTTTNTAAADTPSEDTLATSGAAAEGDETVADGSADKGEVEGDGLGEAKKSAEEEEEEEEAMKALRMSEEELGKLKEEQEERCKELAMNVNVFMPYKGCVDEEQLLADEALAREAARYLWEVALPFLTAEVKRGSLQPLDCAELAKVLHGAGLNVRYLGRLATAAIEEEAEDAKVRAEGKLRRWRMPLFWLEMLETEMVARAATHVFNRYMAKSSSRARHAPGKAVQQFLNCLLGGTQKPTTTSGSMAGIAANGPRRSLGSSSPSALSPYSSPLSSPTSTARGYGSASGSWVADDDFGVVKLTPDGLWRSVSLEVFQRFRHRLELWGAEAGADADKSGRRHKLPLLRRVCQRLGVRVLSRAYQLETMEPFALEDIVGVFPVVKSCVPASPAPDAGEALEMAQLHLTSGSGLQTAHDFAQHAATLLLQACDGMHSKYPAALNLQARVMYLGGDADTAVALQLKALAYFEQLEGLDSASVVKCHEQLGQYYMTAGLYDKALAHMRAFCYLVELAAGPNHPELSSAYHNMGRAYQDLGSAIMALRCYQEALERQPGDHMINPRVHHSVAETLEAMGGYTDALKHERLSHAGFKAVHGVQHPLVAQSTQNIRALTTKIVKAAQQDQHTSILEAAKQASAAAASAEQPPPDPAAVKGGAGKKGGSVSAPAAEPVATGGVEESKMNGPLGSSGQGGGSKSSEKKGKGGS